MVQLIITVLAIALTSAIVVASINYLPVWQKIAANTEEILKDVPESLEKAYNSILYINNGTAPSVLGSSDGGLMAGFGSVLGFSPATIGGYTWVYGKRGTDATQWSDLNYFCLTPSSGSLGASEGAWRGLKRIQAKYSSEQIVISTNCGDITSTATPGSFPSAISLTFYVKYIPS